MEINYHFSKLAAAAFARIMASLLQPTRIMEPSSASVAATLHLLPIGARTFLAFASIAIADFRNIYRPIK